MLLEDIQINSVEVGQFVAEISILSIYAQE